MFVVRGAAHVAAAISVGGLPEAQDWLTYDNIHLIGRRVNALADTITALVIYAIGRRQFSLKVGLASAVLYVFAVLPIQLAHFWTVDILSKLFFVIGLYAVIEVSRSGRFWAYLLVFAP